LRKIRTFLVVAVSSAMIATGAIAADPVMPAPTIIAPPPPTAPAFSWNRAYVGVYAGSWFCCGVMGGVFAGKNFELGNRFVIGIEGMAGAYAGPIFEAYLLARAGLLLGSRVLIYGGIGGGWDAGFVLAAQAGIELALGQSLSARVQGLFWDPFGVPEYAIHGGLAWHFGGR
jgi:outer membrane immunogenic protein